MDARIVLMTRWFLGISKSTSPPIAVYFSVIWWFIVYITRYLKARWMAAVPSEELRTVLWMFVILLTANFKFLNRSTCSKEPVKKAGKVCGDSQDLKSPGTIPQWWKEVTIMKTSYNLSSKPRYNELFHARQHFHCLWQSPSFNV